MSAKHGHFDFDIALSFAGEDRDHAQALADELQVRGVRVFYDYYEQAALWGKDLYQHLQSVYRDQARYCVIFISKAYASKLWPRHELKQAQARAFRENSEYILPVRIDGTEIPGLNATTGYVDARRHDATALAVMLCKKLGIEPAEPRHPFAAAFMALDELEKKFFQFPSVREVSLSRRYVSGTPIKQWSIRVLVREKLPTSKLRREWVLPNSYKGIPIDVLESPKNKGSHKESAS